MGSASLAAARPAACPPARPDRDDNTPPAGGLRGKKVWQTDRQTDGRTEPVIKLLGRS